MRLWNPKIGDWVISKPAFFKKFGYEIRGKIVTFKNDKCANKYLGICFHKDELEKRFCGA